MEIKNGKIVIYELDKNYLDFLSQFDGNVRKKQNRKYIGILVTDKKQDYCIPLTCQVRKRNAKLTFQLREKNCIIAQLTINNMIPVTENLIRPVDIQNDKDKDYLNKEIRILRHKESIEEILKKAENILFVLSNQHHFDYTFFKNLCGDFILLEEKCKEYNRKIYKK